ncbi:glycosyltransferase family 9 protein [bacterium]|nr:glycosyltransferase family 9 protein [bacterium]
MKPSSVLLVRLSALGDVVHALPALSALREALPRAKVGWAVEEKASSLLEGHPELDRRHVIPRGALALAARRRDAVGFLLEAGRSLREVRAERYEVVLDFQSNFRSGLLARLSGAARRIGQPAPYAKEGSRFLLGEAPRPVERSVHKIDRNLALLGLLGITPARAPRPVIPEPEASRALAERFLRDDGRRLVLLHPGVSAFGAFKAWREEGYAALARTLRDRGARVAIAFGGPLEQESAERVVSGSRGAAVLAPRTASILDLAALLKRAALFVGADSGPLHLAAALGTQVVGLYGPKDPRTYGPFWENAKVVRKGVRCSPCTLRRCARPECMTLITADEVALEAAHVFQ